MFNSRIKQSPTYLSYSSLDELTWDAVLGLPVGLEFLIWLAKFDRSTLCPDSTREFNFPAPPKQTRRVVRVNQRPLPTQSAFMITVSSAAPDFKQSTEIFFLFYLCVCLYDCLHKSAWMLVHCAMMKILGLYDCIICCK
jgi:hypothetical protein